MRSAISRSAAHSRPFSGDAPPLVVEALGADGPAGKGALLPVKQVAQSLLFYLPAFPDTTTTTVNSPLATLATPGGVTAVSSAGIFRRIVQYVRLWSAGA